MFSEEIKNGMKYEYATSKITRKSRLHYWKKGLTCFQ